MKTLARDTLIYGFAAILSRGLALLVLPIYTRVLSPSDYGALDLILATGALAAIIVPLEISQAVARLINEPQAPGARRLMASTALWFTVSAYLVALAAALVAAPLIADRLLGGRAMDGVARLGACLIAANGIFYFLQNQLRFELRSRDYVVLSAVYAVLTLSLGIGFGFGLRLGLPGVLIAQLIAALLSTAVGIFQLRASYCFCFDRRMLVTMLGFSSPLMPSGLATFLTLYGNRLLLSATLGLGAVGLFGVATRIANIVTLPLVGFQAALTPLVYAHHAEQATPPRLARIFEGFLAITLFGCLALGLAAPEVLSIVVEPKYRDAAPLVMALAPAAIFSQAYIFFPGIAIARRTYLQLAIFAVTATVSLGANWLLIGTHGLAGAAIATLLSALVFILLWIAVSQRYYRLPISYGRVAALTAAFAAAGGFGLALQTWELGAGAGLMARFLLLIAFAGAAAALGLVRVADFAALVKPRRGLETD